MRVYGGDINFICFEVRTLAQKRFQCASSRCSKILNRILKYAKQLQSMPVAG